MMTPGSRYVQLLQNQPSSNNGTVLGGLGHVLQQALMGHAMGQERTQQEAVQGRMAQALQALQGRTINWNSPRPDGTGEMQTTVPPNRNLAMQLLAGSPETMPYAWDMATQQDAVPDLVQAVDPATGQLTWVPKSQAAGMASALPPEPGAPNIREFNEGGQIVTKQWNEQTGAWDTLATAPRFAPETPPLPSFTNFANPATGEVIAVDLTTQSDYARQLAAQGFIEVGTSVNAQGFGNLNGTPVAGPVDAAGKPIEPDAGKTWVEDPVSPIGYRQEVIPGSAAAQEAAASAESAENSRNRTIAASENIIGLLDGAIDMVKNQSVLSPATGFAGDMASNVSGSRAYNLRAQVAAIQANLALEQMQALKDASPTGATGLGPIAVREFTALESTLANIDPNQSEEVLLPQLQKVREHYSNLIAIIRESQALNAGDNSLDGWSIQRVE